jgi:hypothetical protein
MCNWTVIVVYVLSSWRCSWCSLKTTETYVFPLFNQFLVLNSVIWLLVSSDSLFTIHSEKTWKFLNHSVGGLGEVSSPVSYSPIVWRINIISYVFSAVNLVLCIPTYGPPIFELLYSLRTEISVGDFVLT